MSIKELIYQTPEMSEEKLLEIIDKRSKMNFVLARIVKRVEELHKGVKLSKALLDEWDLIQMKKSNLTKSQRDIVLGFIGMCMIEMTKGNETN